MPYLGGACFSLPFDFARQCTHYPREPAISLIPPWYKLRMLSFVVDTPQHCYSAVVERGVIGHLAQYIPSNAGKLFVVSTEDVWRHQGQALERGLAGVAF